MNSCASTLLLGVGAAVEDVHERHGHDARHRAAEIAVERQAGLLGGRARHRQRDAEDGVGAELALVGGAVGVHHLGVHGDLVGGVEPLEPRAEHLVHVPHRLQHALAAVALRVAVAEFRGLVLAGRGAARHGGPAVRAARQDDLGLDGGVAAAVDDFARVDFDDGGHGCES